VKQVIVAGKGREADRCCGFFKKYGFDARILKPGRKNAESISSADCPIVAAGGKAAGEKLRGVGIKENLLIEHSILWAEDTERLIDVLSFNSEARPNEYAECLLDNYPQSAGDMIGTLADYQTGKIKKDIDPEQKTLGVFYPTPAYRSNLGGEEMYENIRRQGYNVVFLFGTVCNDKYEKREYSYYAGRGIVGYLDFVDVFIIPTLLLGLPEKSKKILFVHDIYDSPAGKAEASRKGPDGKPRRVSRLIDELDYTFLPCRSIMPKSNISPLIRKKPLCRIPGGYIKLDRNLRHFESRAKDLPVDSIIYAPTVTKDVFADYVSLPAYGGEIIAALLENFPDYRIIFRPHPHTLNTEDVSRVVSRFSDCDGFVFDSNPSFYMDNYTRSALMVTDMSGTAFTYAFTTLRPVVFFSHNEETVEDAFNHVKYFRDRSKVGYVVTDVGQLKEKVELGLSKQEEFTEHIRLFRDSEIFNVGKAEDYFAQNFPHIAEGTRNDDWQYVVSPIVPLDDELEQGDTLDDNGGGLTQRPLLIEKSGPSKPGRKLIEQGYKGFNIISCDGKVYGLAQSEGRLDLDKVGTEGYRCVVGELVDEVRQLIDAKLGD